MFLAALLLTGGSLGDRYGRKRIYLVGLSLFALASTWCGLAPDIHQLIISRAVQGVGAALLVPGSLAIISASFDSDRRGAAIGTWSGFTSITTAIGPVLGGWLIEHVSWRAVFFINLPLAAVVLVLTLWRVPESRDEEDTARMDWVGAVLATLGLGAAVYGLIESSRLGFGNGMIICALAGGLILLVAFVLLEGRVRAPMMPLSLFRSRNFSGANALTLLLYAALGGTFFFLPLELIQVQGYTATQAGAALLPFILIMFSLSRWSGGLVKRYGPRLPLVIGPLIAAAGFALFLMNRPGEPYWTTVFPAVVVLGLGMAVSVAPLTTTVMGSVHQNRAGIASGINNAVSRTAGLLAVAVLGIVMVAIFEKSLAAALNSLNLSSDVYQAVFSQKVRLGGIQLPSTLDTGATQTIRNAIQQSFLNAFRVVMLISSGMAAASGLIAWLMIQGTAIRKLSHRGR